METLLEKPIPVDKTIIFYLVTYLIRSNTYNVKFTQVFLDLKNSNHFNGPSFWFADIYQHSIYLLLFSCSVVSNSLWPHGLQHAGLSCPSPSPGACSNSCPLSRGCYPTHYLKMSYFLKNNSLSISFFLQISPSLSLSLPLSLSLSLSISSLCHTQTHSPILRNSLFFGNITEFCLSHATSKWWSSYELIKMGRWPSCSPQLV